MKELSQARDKSKDLSSQAKSSRKDQKLEKFRANAKQDQERWQLAHADSLPSVTNYTVRKGEALTKTTIEDLAKFLSKGSPSIEASKLQGQKLIEQAKKIQQSLLDGRIHLIDGPDGTIRDLIVNLKAAADSSSTSLEEFLRPLREIRSSRDQMRNQITHLDEVQARSTYQAWIDRHFPDEGARRSNEIYDMNQHLRYLSRDQMRNQITHLDEVQARSTYQTWIDRYFPNNSDEKRREVILMDKHLRDLSLNHMLNDIKYLDDAQAYPIYEAWVDRHLPNRSIARSNHIHDMSVYFASSRQLDDLLRRSSGGNYHNFTQIEQTLLNNALEANDKIIEEFNIDMNYVYQDQNMVLLADIMRGGTLEQITPEERQSNEYKSMRDIFYAKWQSINRKSD